MKITELNNCIEQMRKCYKFADENTEIRIQKDIICNEERRVEVCTINENGTQIIMSRRADEIVERAVEGELF